MLQPKNKFWNPFQKEEPRPKHPPLRNKIFKVDHSTGLAVEIRLIFFDKACEILEFDLIYGFIRRKRKSAKWIKYAISIYRQLVE